VSGLASASEVGSLLALLHDADTKVQAFEGEFRDWARPPASTALIAGTPTGQETRLRWQGAGPFPRRREHRRRVWFEPPSRLRVELLQEDELLQCGVCCDGQWWRWDKATGVQSGSASGAAGGTALPQLLRIPLLTPVVLVPSFRFAPSGARSRLGRQVVVVDAVARNALTTGAPSFEFEFDATYGTGLRWATFSAGRCVGLTEAVAAQFDLAIDPRCFSDALPPES
jgi:hypothetical protein